MQKNFLDTFVHYLSGMESPAIYARWTAIAGVGAILGRNFYITHNHSVVHPNVYCMLLGTSGARKSTPIKILKNLLKEIGYNTIAADRSSKEKFLLDLSGDKSSDGPQELDSFLDESCGDAGDAPAEMFIMADEFNDFIGLGNLEFASLLGTLWDFQGVYDNRLKNSKSILINEPTVSILGGNTPTGFSSAFPQEALGQGFFSRMLLIHGEPTGKRIAFPEPPTEEEKMNILRDLLLIRTTVNGPAELTPAAKQLLIKIYDLNPRVDDARFDAYSSRRFTHLLKLCLICAASRLSVKIEPEDVIFANTILYAAEFIMPNALGEFGKAKNSDVAHKVIGIIETHDGPIKIQEIWKGVHKDCEDMKALGQILQKLLEADRIQRISAGGISGFLPKIKVSNGTLGGTIDYSLLTPEERKLHT